ncbi:MAG: penicillin-binding protein 2 [Ignavibacteriaceae bacterium]|nr:penicillin-binding protein 2 [Ignavibacteriaceae bacterium]
MQVSSERKTILFALLVGVFFLFSFRLFQLQIVQQRQFDEKSSDNSIKAIEQIPLRGVFYDRDTVLIVENIPAYTVRVTPSEYNRMNNHFIEKILDLDSGYVDNLLLRNKQYSKYIPLKVKRGASFESIGWIEENHEFLPGVDYIIEMQRNYPAGIMASHAFGYSKEISPQQLKLEKEYYTPGDVIGYNGLEKYYEKILRGKKGYNFILVDSRRREVGKFKNGEQDIPSIKGKDLALTFDVDVQQIAEQEFKGKSGAAVAIEPSTGEIIAMASGPDYDLNQFSYVTSREYLRQLSSNPLKPQFNRATMAAHPPGSTFKVLCALVGLELGVITEKSLIHCGGGFTFGRFFKCHGSHGATDVYRALEKSCNVFFYQLIFRIGLNRLADYANKFGLGVKTEIDLGEEARGLIPRTNYYEKIYGKNWPQGILVSLGIGQGEVSVTPLQLAYYTALVANNGKSYKPHFVKGYFDEFKKLHPFEYEMIDTKVSQKSFEIVKKGMFLVVNGAGTATNVRIPGVHVAGKTGTAQNPHGKDHALFIGFAPYENPQIAVAVLVENVGFGSTHAAPIAKKMIEIYLRKKGLINEVTSTEIAVMEVPEVED